MKQVLIVLILVLMFSSVSNTETSVANSDSIRISFNKSSYVKKFPKNYTDAVEVIKTMETLFNKLSATYDSLDSSHNEIKNKSKDITEKVNISSNKITLLTASVDSLTNLIEDKSVALKKYAVLFTDSLKVLANLIDKNKRDLHIGVGIGYANGDFTFRKLNEYTITPMIMFRNIYASMNLGIYDTDDKIWGKIGTNAGFFFR